MKNIYDRFNIKNKVVVVVGGSGQLGLQTLKYLIDADSIVINLDLINSFNKNNNNYYFYKVDVSREAQVKKVVQKIKKKFKKINILINHSHFKGNKKDLIPFHNFFSSHKFILKKLLIFK